MVEDNMETRRFIASMNENTQMQKTLYTKEKIIKRDLDENDANNDGNSYENWKKNEQNVNHKKE